MRYGRAGSCAIDGIGRRRSMQFDSKCRDNSEELGNLLDRVEKDLESGLVTARIFSDDAVFTAEMERIFTRNWVFVGHVSEIPKKGDYVLRRIGLDQVLVTRDEEGEINVISNICRH